LGGRRERASRARPGRGGAVRRGVRRRRRAGPAPWAVARRGRGVTRRLGDIALRVRIRGGLGFSVAEPVGAEGSAGGFDAWGGSVEGFLPMAQGVRGVMTRTLLVCCFARNVPECRDISG